MTYATEGQQAAPPHPADEAEEATTGPIFDGAGVALAAVDRAAIDSQIATAKQYPRSMTEFLREARSLATLDEQTAESMFYTLKRRGADGKDTYISGPSVRLAEIAAYAYRNLRVDGDVESEDAKFITAVGTCFDLERNVAVRTRVRRRITTNKGKRYGDDMIGVTANAAISIAVRNAIVRVVPRVFINQIYELARKTALGDSKAMSTKRLNAVAWFETQGATRAQLFKLLGVKGLDDIGEEQYLNLVGLKNSVTQGETTVAALVRDETTSEDTAGLNQAIETRKADGAPLKPSELVELSRSAESKAAPPDSGGRLSPAIVEGKPCQECGADVGKPHKSACPHADD